MDIRRAFQLALRSMKRRPVFSLGIVLLLCLGIGMSTSTFGLVYYIFTESLPYGDSGRLVLIHDVYSKLDGELLGVSEPELFDYREARSFSGVAAIDTSKVTLSLAEPRQVWGARVSASLLDVLGVQPAAGRSFLPEEEKPGAAPVAIVSQRVLRSWLSCPDLRDCRISVEGTPHSVVGVLPPGFRLPDDLTTASQTEILLPLQLNPAQLSYRDNPRLTVVARLAPTATQASAQEEMSRIAQTLTSRHAGTYVPEIGYGIRLRGLRSSILGDSSFALTVMVLAIFFLFVVALVNAGNFLLVASAERTGPLLTSLALGAPMRTLRAQLLVESSLLAILAFIPGVLLGWGLFLFVARLSAGRLLPLLRDAHLSPSMAAFAMLLLLLASGTIFLIPQGGLSRARRLLPAINREVRTIASSRANLRMQSVLLVVQVAFSTALIALFLLVGLSQSRLNHVSLGFVPEDVHVQEIALSPVAYQENARVVAFFDAVLARLRAEGGFAASCLATSPPLVQRNETWPFDIADRAALREDTPAFGVEIASSGCLRTLGIPLNAGSDLPAHRAPGTAPVALVSESLAARLWPSRSPVGQRIRPRLVQNGPWVTVVGVVGDVRHEGPNAEVREIVYLHYADIPALTGLSVRTMRFLASSPPGGTVRERVRSAVASVDGSVPVEDLGTLGDLRARLTAPWTFAGQLLSVTTLLGPALAVAGLYSLLSTLIVLRRREMGIRVALGATQGNLLVLLSRQTLARLLAGGLAGAWLALLLFSRLRPFLPQTELGEAVAVSAFGVLTLMVIGILASASLVPTLASQASTAYRGE